MSILEALGLRSKKPNPKPISTIKLHPECMTRHATLVSTWLAAKMPVEVLNPSTNEWEECDNPIFSPEHEYRAIQPTSIAIHNKTKLVNTKVIDVPPWFGESVPAPIPAPIPAPTCKYQRGDIYISTTGKKFLVLGNKYDLVPNYNPSNDPDSNPLIVMRYDDGVKQAVSCRDFQGKRADGNTDFSLYTKYGDSGICDVARYTQPHVGYTLIYCRNNAKDVYVNNTTGEVTFL